MQKSRTTIHQEDLTQIADLKVALEYHSAQNDIHDKLYDTKIDKLMPLVDLIEPLRQIVDDRQANTIIAKKVIQIIGVIGAIVGIIWASMQIIHNWKG